MQIKIVKPKNLVLYEWYVGFPESGQIIIINYISIRYAWHAIAHMHVIYLILNLETSLFCFNFLPIFLSSNIFILLKVATFC